jgi:hypothetical protein
MKRSEKFKSSFALSLAAAGVFYALRKRPKRIRPGQVAVITGGSSGLGLALAHELGRAGLRLALAARDIEQLHLAKRELLLSGSVNDEEDLVLIQCDVSDKHQAARLIESCLTTFDGIDLLFNDAGVIDVGPIEDQTIETFEKAMSINFFGAVHTVLSVLPYFLEKKQAAIVNISSIGGKIPVPHLLPALRTTAERHSRHDCLSWVDAYRRRKSRPFQRQDQSGEVLVPNVGTYPGSVSGRPQSGQKDYFGGRRRTSGDHHHAAGMAGCKVRWRGT